MSFSATVYRVLVASPGDLAEERGTIEDTIYRWNAIQSAYTHAVLLPVLWETHSVPELGDRPQAILNRRIVPECDVLIGAFWTRLGTPTGAFASGTVEEIEEFARAGKPVLLYFSSRQIDPDLVDLEQLKQLREVKARFRQIGLVQDFASPPELREKLTRHLHELARRLISHGVSPEKPTSPPPVPHPTSAAPTGTHRPDHGPLSADHTAAQLLYYDYWKELGEALARSGSRLRRPTPRAKNWTRFPARGSGARIHAFASIRERYLGVELALDRDCAEIFNALQVERVEIEKEMGQELEWIEHPGSYRIVVKESGFDPADRTDWNRQHAWFIEKLEQYHRVLVERTAKGSAPGPAPGSKGGGPIFHLELQNTYYERGFFNVVVDYDRYVRKTDGPVRLRLGRNGAEIEAEINRRANTNGTARIYGRAPLRKWFQENFQPMDTVAVDLSSEDVIVLEKKEAFNG